jgi:hypothetical protein
MVARLCPAADRAVDRGEHHRCLARLRHHHRGCDAGRWLLGLGAGHRAVRAAGADPLDLGRARRPDQALARPGQGGLVGADQLHPAGGADLGAGRDRVPVRHARAEPLRAGPQGRGGRGAVAGRAPARRLAAAAAPAVAAAAAMATATAAVAAAAGPTAGLRPARRAMGSSLRLAMGSSLPRRGTDSLRPATANPRRAMGNSSPRPAMGSRRRRRRATASRRAAASRRCGGSRAISDQPEPADRMAPWRFRPGRPGRRARRPPRSPRPPRAAGPPGSARRRAARRPAPCRPSPSSRRAPAGPSAAGPPASAALR